MTLVDPTAGTLLSYEKQMPQLCSKHSRVCDSRSTEVAAIPRRETRPSRSKVITSVHYCLSMRLVALVIPSCHDGDAANALDRLSCARGASSRCSAVLLDVLWNQEDVCAASRRWVPRLRV